LLYSPAALLDPHSFPTRRSSDLLPRPARATSLARPERLCVVDDHCRLSLAGNWRNLPFARGMAGARLLCHPDPPALCGVPPQLRSEEHTSELQSRENLVCRLLLE